MKYFIQSNINGKYLSHLFEDRHADMFQADKPESGKAYWYTVKTIADQVALIENGKVIEIQD